MMTSEEMTDAILKALRNEDAPERPIIEATLEVWKTQGLDGLRSLVAQGLAPAAVLGVALHALQTEPSTEYQM